MGKKIFTSAKSYSKNLGIHLWGLIRRRETLSEAAERMAEDSKKLAHTVTRAVKDGRTDEKQKKQANKLVKIGRDHFNVKRYDLAEKSFRRALAKDPSCVWAATYLGYTLYHAGQSEEAVAAWKRAYAMDPASDAGLRALKKIQHVDKVKKELIDTLAEGIDRI